MCANDAKTKIAQGSSMPLTISQVHTGNLWRLMDRQYHGSEYATVAATGCGVIGKHTPLQQKILLASLLLMVKHKASKEVKLGKLMDTFKKVMSKRRMQIKPNASAMMKLSYTTAPRLTKVILKTAKAKVVRAFEGKVLPEGILDDINSICE